MLDVEKAAGFLRAPTAVLQASIIEPVSRVGCTSNSVNTGRNSLVKHLLAICGSLRSKSSNLALLEAAQLIAPDGIEVEVYRSLATIPPFNPDEDTDALPPAVSDLRQRIGRADGLLISSPEYARGVAGVLKNALDWLVSGAEFPGIPIAVLNASPRAIAADAALRLTLTTMSAQIVVPASITLSLMGRNLTARQIAGDHERAPQIVAALRAMPARER